MHSWIKQSKQWILWLLKIQTTALPLRALRHRVSVIQFDQTHGTLLVLASSWGHVCLEYNLIQGFDLLLNINERMHMYGTGDYSSAVQQVSIILDVNTVFGDLKWRSVWEVTWPPLFNLQTLLKHFRITKNILEWHKYTLSIMVIECTLLPSKIYNAAMVISQWMISGLCWLQTAKQKIRHLLIVLFQQVLFRNIVFPNPILVRS